jgi:thiamine pyrophosphokinase
LLPDISNPFLEVTSNQAKRIDEVYAIRNYLAHYSAKSKRTLQHVYKTEYEMTKFLEPGRFLLAYKAKWLWHYFDAFEGASNKMKAWY